MEKTSYEKPKKRAGLFATYIAMTALTAGVIFVWNSKSIARRVATYYQDHCITIYKNEIKHDFEMKFAKKSQELERKYISMLESQTKALTSRYEAVINQLNSSIKEKDSRIEFQKSQLESLRERILAAEKDRDMYKRNFDSLTKRLDENKAMFDEYISELKDTQKAFLMYLENKK